MPYIPQHLRTKLELHLNRAALLADTDGGLNYALSRLVHLWLIAQDQFDYATLVRGLAALEAAKLEYYRHVMAPYEDEKRRQHGSVSLLEEDPQ
jgi:hypothetical protein